MAVASPFGASTLTAGAAPFASPGLAGSGLAPSSDFSRNAWSFCCLSLLPYTRVEFSSSALISASRLSCGVMTRTWAPSWAICTYAPPALVADVLPDLGALAVAAALHRVDQDALLGGQLARLGVLDVVLVVHVRRGVADQEDDPERGLVVGPLEPGDRLVQGLDTGK